MQNVYLEHTALAGERVNRHFSTRRTIGKVVKRPPGEGGFVVVDFGCAVKAIAPQLDAVGIREFDDLCKRPAAVRRADLPATKAHRTRAAVVQPADELRQVVPHGAGSVLRRACIEVGACGRCSGRCVGDFAGVAGGTQNALKSHTQLVGHNLRHLGVQTLTHFSAAVVDLHAAVQVHMHQATGLVEQRGRE